jgi:protein TonB
LAPSPPPAKPHPQPTNPPKARPLPPPRPDPAKIERDQARAEAKDRARDARRQQRNAAAHPASSNESKQVAAQRPVSSGSNVATWRGEVMARISAFKPASNGASGSAVVAFTVDAGGRVISAGVITSSGDATLDAACVSMVRRASPVPAPPPELGGHVKLVVPVRFQ